MSFVDDDQLRRDLRKPFDARQIGKLPRKIKDKDGKVIRTIQLDYVGHAAVTDRLNKACPDWTFTVDERWRQGETVWVLGSVTIGGITRPECGDGSDLKAAISNLIRRGAMRFGVALDLWSKEELEIEETVSAQGTEPAEQAVSAGTQSAPLVGDEQDAAAASAEDEGEASSADGGAPTDEQWERALRHIGNRAAILKAVRALFPEAKVRQASDIDAHMLAMAIAEAIS